MFNRVAALTLTVVGVMMAPIGAQADPEGPDPNPEVYNNADGKVCTNDHYGVLKLRADPDLSARVKERLPRAERFLDLKQTHFNDDYVWRKIAVDVNAGPDTTEGWAAQLYLCRKTPAERDNTNPELYEHAEGKVCTKDRYGVLKLRADPDLSARVKERLPRAERFVYRKDPNQVTFKDDHLWRKIVVDVDADTDTTEGWAAQQYLCSKFPFEQDIN